MKYLVCLSLALVACNPSTTTYLTPEAEPREQEAIKVVQTIRDGETLGVEAVCPEGTRLLTGGCTFGHFAGAIQAIGSTPQVAMLDGEPVSPAEATGWLCTGRMRECSTCKTDEVDNAGSITALAVCEWTE